MTQTQKTTAKKTTEKTTTRDRKQAGRKLAAAGKGWKHEKSFTTPFKCQACGGTGKHGHLIKNAKGEYYTVGSTCLSLFGLADASGKKAFTQEPLTPERIAKLKA